VDRAGETGITEIPVAGRYVSVVIPTHNRPGLLAAAVASVLAQDVPVEVIVVDDASTPPAAGLPALDDPRVKVVRNEVAIGPTKARNQGVELASGAFVAFLDDDDTWLPGKLSRCLEILDAAEGVDVVAHRTVFDARQANGTTSDFSVVTDPLTRFGLQQTPHLDGIVVDARLAKEVGFDESLDAAQDVDFVIGLARRSPFAMVDDALALRGDDGEPSAIGLDRRIVARARLRAKHPDVLYRDGPSRSFYHVRLGHLYRRAGDRGRAIRNFLEAIRYDPAQGQAWRGVFLTMLPASAVLRLSIERRTRAAR
jgi:glycosyltransferase involved in cell wall biosynthesis